MEILRKLRWLFYSAAFALVFFVGIYWTFPTEVLRNLAENSITRAAALFGPRAGEVPAVLIDDVSLWRLSGINVKNLTIDWPTDKKEAALSIKFDSIKGKMGIFSFLTGSNSIYADIDFYGGDVEAWVKMKKQALSSLTVSALKMDLGKMSFVPALLGSPLEGKLNLDLDLDAATEFTKDGTGTINMQGENLAYGPGIVKLPSGGFASSLTVPKVILGKLAVEMVLDKGQFDSKSFTLSGGDLEAELTVNISLGRKPTSSKLMGNGWFSVKREFINANETIKMLFDLIPELKSAQMNNGKVGLLIRGTLARPQFKIERYVSNKHDKGKAKVAKADGK